MIKFPSVPAAIFAKVIASLAIIAVAIVDQAGSVPAVVRTVLADPMARRSAAEAPRANRSPRVVSELTPAPVAPCAPTGPRGPDRRIVQSLKVPDPPTFAEVRVKVVLE